jgi:hypothetical protein
VTKQTTDKACDSALQKITDPIGNTFLYIGCAVGGLVVIGLLVFLLRMYWRRRSANVLTKIAKNTTEAVEMAQLSATPATPATPATSATSTTPAIQFNRTRGSKTR